MRIKLLLIFLVFIGCQEISRDNLNSPELLDKAIIKNISIPFYGKDTLVERIIGICGNSSKEELSKYYYFNGKKNRKELEQRLTITYLPYQELGNRTYSMFDRNIQLKISGNILTNSSVQILESVSYLDTNYYYSKLFEFKSNWELIEVKVKIEYPKYITKIDSLKKVAVQVDSTNFTDENGLKQGKWIQKMNNGFILRKNNYLDGKLHGEQLEYYKNHEIRFKDNFLNGKKNGYQYEYYEGIEQIGFVSYYENDRNLWLGFPRANAKYIIPIKDFHIHSDSVYVEAPYYNGNTWYEGAFLNPKEKSITGKRVGIHKVYHTNGQLKATLNYETNRISEYDSLGTVLRDNDTFENGTRMPTKN